MNLGESIRNIRRVKGLSQGEMQKRTGILRSYLSRVENGHTVPSFATLQRLASAMEVNLADFFSGEEAPVPSSGAALTDDVPFPVRALQDLKNYLPQLSAEQRQELLQMVKEMAQTRKH
jgi:transcriptional regulator with XRE-family HTH domain